MVNEEPSKKKARAEPLPTFQTSCEDAVGFRLLHSADAESLSKEIEAGGTEFSGEFFHQHFGEEEEITGYDGLEVTLWISAQTFHAWLEIKFKARRPGATKIDKVFAEHFPDGICKSKAEFITAVTSAQLPDFTTLGERAATIEAGPSSPTGISQPVHIQRHTLAKADPAVQVRLLA